MAGVEADSDSVGLGLGPASDSLGLDAHEAAAINDDPAKLMMRWQNEKFAPELLPFAAEVVENISEVVEFVRESLDEERAEGNVQDPCEVNYVLRCLELERIKYVLRDYLRIRLWKLEQWPQHYNEPANNALLSDAEKIYLQQSWDLTVGFFDNRLLCVMPDGKKSLDGQVDCIDMIKRPDLDRHVYAKILGDLGDIEMPPSVTPTQDSTVAPKPLQLAKGQTYLLRYSLVRKFLLDAVHDGKVELV
eukprot:TRINITY_DN7822_c0_g1_i1.p1 TRINITY_DN7822_c0_g1~~TRINITY_DN7822_c0_g1_i1.p1  ORF type:complete len:247 (-),score=72.81 TRINITY_DN7822_c0_g1_i1:139-879(-)